MWLSWFEEKYFTIFTFLEILKGSATKNTSWLINLLHQPLHSCLISYWHYFMLKLFFIFTFIRPQSILLEHQTRYYIQDKGLSTITLLRTFVSFPWQQIPLFNVLYCSQFIMLPKITLAINQEFYQKWSMIFQSTRAIVFAKYYL